MPDTRHLIKKGDTAYALFFPCHNWFKGEVLENEEGLYIVCETDGEEIVSVGYIENAYHAILATPEPI